MTDCEHVFEDWAGESDRRYCVKCSTFEWWLNTGRLQRCWHRFRTFIWHLPPRVDIVHMEREGEKGQVDVVAYLWWFRWRLELKRRPAL